ncbi:MAG: hypothetical protein GY801_18260, partial [bacterium]|nr:hypothetical protein [bacterium]
TLHVLAHDTGLDAGFTGSGLFLNTAMLVLTLLGNQLLFTYSQIDTIFRHPSFFGLHFSLALVPDRDPLRHTALPLDRYRNRDRYRVSFHFDYDCDPDFDFDGASQKSVNYFLGTMKDAVFFTEFLTQSQYKSCHSW